MAEQKVQIRGIRELNRAFKNVEGDLKKDLKAGFLEIATTVAEAAREGVPEITGNAKASIKPRATSRGASIAFGGSKAEYYPWLDFGGSVGKNKSVKRPFVKEGRYVYPAIKAHNDFIKQKVDDVLEATIKKSGFETHQD